MSLISIHPIKPFLEAWNRLRSKRGESVTRATKGKPKLTQVRQPHHRHAAFLEFP
jgi:hypothetical protein